MGYIIDALFFRLKFTKSWFYIGFVRKKFYSYLIALQSNIFNYLIFMFTRDLKINNQGFYLSSLKLIQKYSYFVLLLTGKMSETSPIFMPVKKKYFHLPSGYSRRFRFFSDDFLTHYLIRAHNKHVDLKTRRPHLRKYFELTCTNNFFSDNLYFSPIKNQHDYVHVYQPFYNYIPEILTSKKSYLFLPKKSFFDLFHKFNLKSFWLNYLLFSKKRKYFFKGTTRYRLLFANRLQKFDYARKYFTKIFPFFKGKLFFKNSNFISSKFYFKKIATLNRLLLKIRKTKNLSWKKLLLNFISYSDNAFKKSYRLSSLYSHFNFICSLFKKLYRKTRKAKKKRLLKLYKNSKLLIIKYKLILNLKLCFIKLKKIIKKVKRNKKINKNKKIPHPFKLKKIINEMLIFFTKRFFSFVNFISLSKLSFSKKLKFINVYFWSLFSQILYKNFYLFKSNFIYLKLLITKLNIYTLHVLLSNIKKKAMKIVIPFISRVLKLFNSLSIWFERYPYTLTNLLFPPAFIKHAKIIFKRLNLNFKKAKRLIKKPNGKKKLFKVLKKKLKNKTIRQLTWKPYAEYFFSQLSKDKSTTSNKKKSSKQRNT